MGKKEVSGTGRRIPYFFPAGNHPEQLMMTAAEQ